LGHITLVGGGTAGEAGGLEDIDARVGGPRAVIGGVVVAGPALRGAEAARRGRGEAVCRAGARSCRAGLRHIALAGRGAADEAGVLEDIDAGVAGAGAVIGGVVVARPALRGSDAARAARGEDVGRAGARG